MKGYGFKKIVLDLNFLWGGGGGLILFKSKRQYQTIFTFLNDIRPINSSLYSKTFFGMPWKYKCEFYATLQICIYFRFERGGVHILSTKILFLKNILISRHKPLIESLYHGGLNFKYKKKNWKKNVIFVYVMSTFLVTIKTYFDNEVSDVERQPAWVQKTRKTVR